jgi:hypothetical protein
MLVLAGDEQQDENHTKIIFIICTLHKTLLEIEDEGE